MRSRLEPPFVESPIGVVHVTPARAGAGESRRAHAIIARARTLRASRVARDGARARARGGRSARRCARGSFDVRMVSRHVCEPWSAVAGERGAESRVLRRRRRARGAPDGLVSVARDCECVVDRVRPERARGLIL